MKRMIGLVSDSEHKKEGVKATAAALQGFILHFQHLDIGVCKAEQCTLSPNFTFHV